MPAPPLTPEQRAIVERQAGPVLVEAGVGCGKTAVLVERARHALQAGVPAVSMLALTFTNRAAQEMRDRLVADAAPDSTKITISTFHALCARILRESGKELAIDSGFAVWDEEDVREAVYRAARQSKLPDDRHEVNIYAEQISEAKRKHYYPQNYPDQTDPFLACYRAYQRELTESFALDYDDLVQQTRLLLLRSEQVRVAWATRFTWVEVDEFQDTDKSEYDVIRLLAQDHRNICVFADTNQSIYGWRGVDGGRVLDRFKRDFPEHARLALSRSFRPTPRLLSVARAVLDSSFEGPRWVRDTAEGAAANPPDGVAPTNDADAPPLLSEWPVVVHALATEEEERDFVARRVRQWHDAGLPWGAIAVLTRSNAPIERLAERLAAHEIPNVTVAATGFFRRRAVKDLIAYLRVAVAPHDIGAVRCVATLPPLGLSAGYLHQVETSGRASFARLTDFADLDALRAGDPCAAELELAAGEYVALDCETTGTNPDVDEVIALGAVRVDGVTGQRQYFDALLRPSRPVGASEAIHGYSDADLTARGRDPRLAFTDLLDFIGDRPLVGHNIDVFDLPLLNANLRRLDLSPIAATTADTLPLSVRVLQLDRHDLARVAGACGVPQPTAHNASSDARCAADCFQVLVGRLRETAAARRELVAEAAGRFLPLAQLVAGWRRQAASSPVSELTDTLLDESGYGARLARQGAEGERDRETLRQLRVLLVDKFDAVEGGRGARALLEHISLAKSADPVGVHGDRLSLLTMHTAKGLEFNAVLIAGAHDGQVPAYWAHRDGADLGEERRLLYVAMTRAKERLELTYPRSRTTKSGARYPCELSRFLRALPDGVLVLDGETG